METGLSILVGLGLSAAVGFRVFVPLLIMSVAAHTGHLTLASGFSWIGSTPALIAFSVATILEIAGYFVPVVDHALDVIAAPAAVVAGTITTAGAVLDIEPFFRWTLAIIAGGGIAGLIHGLTGATRVASRITTAGLSNPAVAVAEAGSSVILSTLAILVPVIAFVLVFGFLVFAGRKLGRRLRRSFSK
jgi:hypothetical protein